MEDRRLSDWAETVVSHSLRVSEGEIVGVDFHSGARDFANQIGSEIRERGAESDLLEIDLEQREEFIQENSSDQFREVADSLLSRYEAMDARVMIRAPLYIMNLDSEEVAEFHEPRQQLVDEILNNTRRVDVEYPTALTAEDSVLETDELRRTVYDASNLDYQSLEQDAIEVKGLLDSSSSVSITGRDETSLSFELGEAERQPVTYLGHQNLPGGEVFVAPVKDTVDGEIYFDAPVTLNGTTVQGIMLEFENGEIDNYEASEGEGALETLIEADDGSRYVGEFGIGLNPEINSYTGRSLIDEKRKGTVHLALGRSYPENFRGDYPQRNQSSVHQDFVTQPQEVCVDRDLLLDERELKV